MTFDKKIGHHYKILENPMKIDIEEQKDGSAIYSITNKIMAKMSDVTESAIVDAIIDEAIREGVSDLYILNKQFIISAILEKIERDEKGE